MSSRKRGHSDDGTYSAETRAKIAANNAAADEVVHGGPRSSWFTQGEQVLRDIQWLLARGDGWMRWTSDSEGKVVFLKYKFTSLTWPNHYVFVSGPVWDVALWMAALVRKCERVDTGELVPTQDKPFNHM